MKSKFLMALISLFLCAQTAAAAEVVFTIPADIGDTDKDWNTAENPVLAHVGDTFTLVNGDSVTHQLHTPGRPFPHGDEIEAGASAQYLVESPYDFRQEKEPLRDHVNYEQKFYIIVVP
jgi:hypothetical protein